MNFDLLLSNPLAYLKIYLSSDNFNLEEQARAVGNLIVIAWTIYILDWGIGKGALAWSLGIRPRTVGGLLGIPVAPFLHGLSKTKDGEPDNSHIVGNTIAFAILGLFIALQGLRLFYVVTIGIVLISGFGTWLFGREGSIHAGASGVTYGYTGFLLVYGFISRNPLAIFLGALAFLINLRRGWSISGVLPTDAGISWEMHLFGFLGGILMAYLITYVTLSCCSP
jgi:membrane associated rhomboid family serine protease